ncbi:MAG: anion permease [Negativicutes bacterium]
MSRKEMIKAFIVVVVGVILWFIPVPAGLKPQAWKLMSIFVATILGFVLQPLPIGAVALIGITIAAVLNVLTPAQVLTGFGSTTIWLIVAAFIFAKSFIKTGLGRRIAYSLIKYFGDSTLKLSYTFVISDLIMSPAMPSNTARLGGILYPVVRSISSAFGSEPGPSSRRVGSFLITTVYQSDAAVSAMFMTAMTANPMIVTMAAQAAKVELTWNMWFMAAVVPGVVSLLVVPYFIYKVFPPEIKKTPEAASIAAAELDKMGPASLHEKIVAAVFVGALALWATGQYTKLDVLVVALMGVAVMLLTKVLDWKDILEEKGAWDTMVWMGAIIAMAGQLVSTGFIGWFAKTVSVSITGVSWWLTLLVLAVIYMYSHYGFASLVAHVTAMFVAFISVAIAAGAPPYLAVLALAFVANLCMSLTHYAAGPAPIYFGSGYVDQGTWWKIGFMVSVINMVIWIGLGSFWWKVLGLW